MKANKTKETTLVVERIIKASPEQVFEALTNEESLKQWFYPIKRGYTVEVEFEASKGTTYQIDMIDPDGKVYSHKGEIKKLTPNQKIAFTWNSHLVSSTLVTISLREVEGGTNLRLRHEFKPDDKIEGHEEGWQELFENLNNLLTNE